MHWLWIFLGGGIGAAARFGLSSWLLVRTGEGFPWGTLAVNWAGCLAVGIAAALFASLHPSPTLRLFLVTGILGGFTTFSAFGLETVELLADGEHGPAFFYVAASLVGGLAAVALGLALGRLAS